MNNQYILEIPQFNTGWNLKAEILYFSFNGLAHINDNNLFSPKMRMRGIKVTRHSDQFSQFFVNYVTRRLSVFPKAFIKINKWGEGKSLVYTFNQVQLDSISFTPGYADSFDTEAIDISFEGVSMAESSPSREVIGQSQKPKAKNRR